MSETRDGRVAGKVVLITGAARGQGRAHALRFAAEGADLVLCDIGKAVERVDYTLPGSQELEDTARQARELGAEVIARPVDVRDSAALEALVDECRARFGRLDVVIPQAGIVSYGRFGEVDEEMWRDTIDVNLTGVWRTVQASLPLVIDGGRGGSIVLVSSTAGAMGFASMPHYVAAKHGVVGLMRSLANEVGTHSIRVNVLLAGMVNTPMGANSGTFRSFRPDLADPSQQDADAAMRAVNLIPVPWVEPEDMAAAALWLASDDSRYVTGAAIPVDAGYMAKAH
jgi:SDR family mycofactocin-dependent oxidoreductase